MCDLKIRTRSSDAYQRWRQLLDEKGFMESSRDFNRSRHVMSRFDLLSRHTEAQPQPPGGGVRGCLKVVSYKHLLWSFVSAYLHLIDLSVEEGFEKSLKELDCECIDLYPNFLKSRRCTVPTRPDEHSNFIYTWNDIEKLLTAGEHST